MMCEIIIKELKLDINSMENVANNNGLFVKGLEMLHQNRLYLKRLMDKEGKDGKN